LGALPGSNFATSEKEKEREGVTRHHLKEGNGKFELLGWINYHQPQRKCPSVRQQSHKVKERGITRGGLLETGDEQIVYAEQQGYDTNLIQNAIAGMHPKNKKQRNGEGKGKRLHLGKGEERYLTTGRLLRRDKLLPLDTKVGLRTYGLLSLIPREEVTTSGQWGVYNWPAQHSKRRKRGGKTI